MLRMHKTCQKPNLIAIACAAFAGGIAGTLVGLMLAPKSGKELRRGIYKKADDVMEHVEDAAEDAVADASDAVEDTIDQVEEVTSHHAGVIKKQGTILVGKGKQFAENIQNTIQESLKPKA